MKKKYKFQTILLLALAMVFLTTSCHKQTDKDYAAPKTNDNFSLLGIIERYYKVANTKVDGKFMFESNLCNNDPTLTNISLAGGIFYDKNGNPQTGGGLVSIGDNKWMPNSLGTYGFDKALPQKGLFGQDVTFTLTPPSELTTVAGINTVTTTLYSPLPISITNVPPMTSVTLLPNNPTTLNWNADPNNPNGVIIIAEYLPTRYVNKSALSAGNSYLIESSMLVPDNGSASIPWSFFSNFPAIGHIILWVARGNYTIAGDGTYNYQVGGYSAAAVWDVKQSVPPHLTLTGTPGYSSSGPTTGSGTISGPVGYTVTVTMHATGTPACGLTVAISGVTTTGPTSVTNGTASFTFVIPASGIVYWNATLVPSGPGGGSFSIQ